MLKRKKRIIAKVMATTMLATTLASTFAVEANAQEPRASVTSSKISGDDRYKTAVEISKNYSSTSKHAVVVNGQKGIVDALTATPYASLKKAPILMTQNNKLNEDTKKELTRRGIKTVDIIGGTASVSDSVKAEIEKMGITVNRIAGNSKYETSLKVAKEVDKISNISKIAVANGEVLADAVSVAAPAAQNKMPIILAHPSKGLDDATKTYIKGEGISTSYVIGGTSSVSNATQNSLPGTKKRLEGTGRQETNAKVVKEFYDTTSHDNIYVTKSGQVNKADEIADALAVGVLAAHNQDPVLIVGKNLAGEQKTLLEDREFDKITEVGNGIPTASINAIKDTQKEPEVKESKISSVTVADNKTIYLNGTDLDLIGKSNVTMTGNTVSSYSVNTAGTKATVVFNNIFKSGVTNTVNVKSNLGKTTNHTFTYKAPTVGEISSVEATTTEVSVDGIQYLEFTVNNGAQKTVSELKELGWNVKFRSTEEIFYSYVNEKLGKSKISETGRLQTVEKFTDKDVFDYEVVLTKGDKEIKSQKVAVTVKDKSNDVKEIKSHQLIFGKSGETQRNLNSSTVLVGENLVLESVKVTNLNGSESELRGGYKIESSNPNVITIKDGNVLEAREAGTSKITITLGDKTREFTLTVKNVSGNERKIKSASFSSSSVKIASEQDAKVTMTVKDQYGDPVILDEAKINAANGLKFADIKNSSKKVIAIATISKTIADNKKGEYAVTITENLPEGTTNTQTGRAQIQYNGDDLSGSLSVSVYPLKDEEKITTKKVEVDSNSISDDLTIDRYLTSRNKLGLDQDNELDLVVNGYNSSGYFIDEISLEDRTEGAGDEAKELKYTVTSSNDKIATATKVGNKIQIRCADTREAGTIDIKIYESINGVKKQLGSTVRVTVKDSTPTVTDIKLNEISKITELKKDGNNLGDIEFKVEELFDIVKTNVLDGDGQTTTVKNVVRGVELKGLQSANQKEVLFGIKSDGTPILFLDNGNGVYNEDGDNLLLTIDLDVDATIDNKATNKKSEVNLTKNQKGNIVVRLYHGAYTTGDPVFKSTTIAVDIQDAKPEGSAPTR